ncbi:MAG: aldo/keto reductase, partial [Dehalococcoidia bacterium]|nr:aldo/keto reductase [Dehalococcoidia bacterium]
LQEIASAHGRSLTQFALAWLLRSNTVTSTIFGATSLRQLEENLRATELTLSEEELAGCDDVWRHLRPLRFFYGR